MGEPWTREGFVAKLEEAGESEVRLRLGQNVYGDTRSEKRQLVELWLSDKSSERDNAKEAASRALAREANDLAREANSLALRAVTNASAANTIAKAALAVAIVAAIASGVMGYLQFQSGSTSPVQASPSTASSPQL